jgi:hypothetical protein
MTRPDAAPEQRPDLDLPVWQMLARLAPEWLLPGAPTVPADTILVLQANPVFVDALLVGLNSQLLAELRWRNHPVVSGATPLRSFWARLDPASGQTRPDLTGVDAWSPGSTLGDPQHHPGGTPGNDLVLAVRAELFARYPKTLVYLISARHGAAADFTRPPAPAVTRTYPAFQGRSGELAWFGFPDLGIAGLADRWMAVEEVQAGARFRNDLPAGAHAGADTGATFAAATLANPARILVPGPRLTPGPGS